MKKYHRKKILFLILLTIFITSCQKASKTTISSTQITPAHKEQVIEAKVDRILLDEPLNKPAAELSGLGWAGDWLILLPQYPSRFDQHLFRIHKDNIITYLQEGNQEPITAEEIVFISGGVEKQVNGFEGFESITSNGQDVYLTIESNANNMTGYLVKGKWNESFDQLTLSTDSLTEIPSQENISNSSYESVLIFGKRVVTLYEVNGKNVNDQPKAQLFDQNNAFIQSVNMPQIEYRITDATIPNQSGLFWVINYFYPGDQAKLKPAEDTLIEKYGQGKTHARSETVERLIALQFSEDGIILAEKPPLQLELLAEHEARNWEGIAQLDEMGFLLATDSFPETWLAFIPYDF